MLMSNQSRKEHANLEVKRSETLAETSYPWRWKRETRESHLPTWGVKGVRAAGEQAQRKKDRGPRGHIDLCQSTEQVLKGGYFSGRLASFPFPARVGI